MTVGQQIEGEMLRSNVLPALVKLVLPPYLPTFEGGLKRSDFSSSLLIGTKQLGIITRLISAYLSNLNPDRKHFLDSEEQAREAEH